ncbi:hypothetical protein WA158_006507 [Blastocystis sp. Blastoise]
MVGKLNGYYSCRNNDSDCCFYYGNDVDYRSIKNPSISSDSYQNERKDSSKVSSFVSTLDDTCNANLLKKAHLIFKHRTTQNYKALVGKRVFFCVHESSMKKKYPDGYIEGKGPYTFFGCMEYDGEIIDQTINGKGTMIWSDGTRISGQWNKDILITIFSIQYGKGDYQEIKFGIRSMSKLENPSTSVLSCISKNENENKCENKSPLPSPFFVETENYRLHGVLIDTNHIRCSLTYSNGISVEGVFDNQLCYGNGCIAFTNGEKYEGELKNFRRNGKGVQKFNNTLYYSGDFYDDQYSGYGCRFKDDYLQYEGEFSNNKANGLGILYDHGKRIYQGYFIDDCMDKYGTFYSNDNKKQYVGFHHLGVWSGEGRYYVKNDIIIEGFFHGLQQYGNVTVYRRLSILFKTFAPLYHEYETLGYWNLFQTYYPLLKQVDSPLWYWNNPSSIALLFTLYRILCQDTQYRYLWTIIMCRYYSHVVSYIKERNQQRYSFFLLN